MAAEEYDLLTRIWIKVRRNPLEIFMLIILIICVIAAVILAIAVLVKLNDNRKCTSNFNIIDDRKIMARTNLGFRIFVSTTKFLTYLYQLCARCLLKSALP